MLMGKFLGSWLESLDYEYRILPHCSRCQSPRSSCNACVTSCPTAAITIEEGKPVIDPESCTDCGNCVASCPVQAVEGFLPKRTIKNKQFIMDDQTIPSVKELLVYHQKGVSTIVCDERYLTEEWEATIEKVNQVLKQLDEPPFTVEFHENMTDSNEMLSRRELFFSWEKELKHLAKQMTPAKWRFNQESLNIPSSYPDYQFVAITLDTSKCTLCKACQILCKKESLQISETGFSISAQQCTNCSLCQDICPQGAISVEPMIAAASSVDYPIFKKTCTFCHETFETLEEQTEICPICKKKAEYLER